MSKTTMRYDKYVLQIAAPLKVQAGWRLAVEDDSENVFSFKKTQPSGYRTEDAFAVRDDFLAIREPGDAARFFQRYGPFQYELDKKTGEKRTSIKPASVTWGTVQQARKEFEEALLAEGVPAGLYAFVFGRPLRIDLPFSAANPELARTSHGGSDDVAIVPCTDVVEALRASVFLSRMRGFKWKRCARTGCKELFEQDTRHDKIYCGSRCSHLQAVNDYNARKRRQVSSNRKPTTGRREKGTRG
jgi:hypothetical protein